MYDREWARLFKYEASEGARRGRVAKGTANFHARAVPAIRIIDSERPFELAESLRS